MIPVKATVYITTYSKKGFSFTRTIQLEDLPISPTPKSFVVFDDSTKIYVENMTIRSKSEQFPNGCIEISQIMDIVPKEELPKARDYFKNWIEK